MIATTTMITAATASRAAGGRGSCEERSAADVAQVSGEQEEDAQAEQRQEAPEPEVAADDADLDREDGQERAPGDRMAAALSSSKP